MAAGWTSRELFVAAVVVSIPGIKPMFSQSSWFNRTSQKSDDGTGGGRSGGAWTHELVTVGGSAPGAGTKMAGGYETGNKGRSEWRVGGKEIKGHQLTSDGSSEDLILQDAAHPAQPVTGAIQVTTEFKVMMTSSNRSANSTMN